jgi:hypothetical protein
MATFPFGLPTPPIVPDAEVAVLVTPLGDVVDGDNRVSLRPGRPFRSPLLLSASSFDGNIYIGNPQGLTLAEEYSMKQKLEDVVRGLDAKTNFLMCQYSQLLAVNSCFQSHLAQSTASI